MRAFFAWLVREGRWSANPADQVATAGAAQPVRERRALLSEEEAWLLRAAPPERALVYLVALRTGLRRSELAGLTWGDLDLADGESTVCVRASIAKNRRETLLPHAEDAAAALKTALDARVAAGRSAIVFNAVPVMKTFRRDLQSARIAWIEEAPEGSEERDRRAGDTDFLAYEDSAGRFLDFHALRVTYGTTLARAGVRLQVAQRLMRHSTPVLTANVYTRLELHDLRGAVSRLGASKIQNAAQAHEAARRRA